ncbi:hypothetical protein [Aeromonas hydrophila]|uniref:hypothetical protein n=1 Tax=Aeromonas hydrophila TaxID=644 RepID=UPI002B45E7E7|nr:hypothetical protein [Aeromonas hydrophila]
MKILVPHFNLAEYSRNIWRVTALHGQEFDQFKDPEAWAHVAANFKRYDEVEIIAEDGSFFAKGIVLKVTKTSATVHFYVHEDFEQEVSGSADGSKYSIEWGGKAKWRVVRNSDDEIIESHISSKEEAQLKADSLNAEGE